MSEKKVAVLSFSNVLSDPRVVKQIKLANKHYKVDVLGYRGGKGERISGVRYYFLKQNIMSFEYKYPLLLLGKINKIFYDTLFWIKDEYREASNILIKEKYGLIHANDWDSLPVASRSAVITKSKILFDAHEYSFDQGDKPLWKLLVKPFRKYLFRKYQKGVTEIITVSEGIKNLYKKDLGWDSSVILNAPNYIKCKFNATNPEIINLIHHGYADSSRYLEDMVNIMTYLDQRYHMNFYLIPKRQSYMAKLKRMANYIASNRIKFWNPVPRNVLLEKINHFDIGIPAMRVNKLNNLYSLPNKFFEYIMAGLGIAVTPLPMMKKIVNYYNLGIISEDQSIETMAKKINSLKPDMIDDYKKNSLEAAKHFNAEKEMMKLLEIYKGLLK